MVDVRLNLLLLLVLTLPARAAGDAVRTITYSDLAARATVEVMGDRPVLQLHHLDAMGHPDTTLPVMVLSTLIDLPNGTTPQITMEVHRWVPIIDLSSLPNLPDTLSSSVSAQIIGTLNHTPRVAVTTVPWAVNGKLIYVADSLTLTVQTVDAPESPSMIVVNEDRSWYDPSQPYVRVTTSRDGVAAVRIGDVLGLEPRFAGAPSSQLALLYRGQEQPIFVLGEEQLTENAVVYFQGRHPFGDTTWLDIDDSVAVFFLTLRQDGTRERLVPVQGVTGNDTLRSLHLHERIELDTGYYHLGNASSVEFSDYNSDIVYLEGFYWDDLNATARESNTFRYRASPFSGGQASFTAHYVSAADAPAYDPDTRADLVLNGSTSSFLESDGWGRYSLNVDVPTNELPSGIQSLKLFSTGIDSVRNQPSYFSNVLLDWYEIEMDVFPVLDSGRLNASSRSAANKTLEVWNAAASSGVVIDTLHGRIAFLSSSGKGAVVRSGMTRSDPSQADRPWDGTSFRISAVLGDQAVEIDTVNDLILIVRSNNEEPRIYRAATSVSQMAAAISAAAPGSLMAFFNTGVATPPEIRDTLLTRHNVRIPAERYWLMNLIAGGGSTGRGSNEAPTSIGAYLAQRTDLVDRHVLQAALGEASTADLFIADEFGIEGARVRPARLSNVLANIPQADVVMVTHSVHREQAERLAEHRREHSGVTVAIYDIDEILDEFGTGHRSPDALREFLAEFYAEAPLPKPGYVILFGNASWDPRLVIKRGNSGSRRPDQVPTYGRPSSDYFFGLLDDPNDRAVPEVIVGRLPGLTAEDGRHQVDKIIASDTTAFQPWMRRWLFVGGGVEQEGLCDHYRNLLDDPFGSGITFHDAPMCMDTATVCKYDGRANPGYDIKLNVDQGIQWMNYFGHGATDQFDIRGWEPSELTNVGRYGVLATYACQTGAFSNTSVECKNAEYVTAEGTGFAAAVGGTGWEQIATISGLQFRIHEILRESSIREIGELIYTAKLPYAGSGQVGINTVMQYSILGDPLMRVRIDTVPEIYLRPEQVEITSVTGRPEITDEDATASVYVTIGTAGLGTTDPFEAWIIRTYQDVTDTVRVTLQDGICLDETVLFNLPVENMAGEHRLTIIADAFKTLGDDPSDNTITTTMIVLPRSLLPIEPLAHGAIDQRAIAVRILDPLSTPDKTMDVVFEIVRDGEIVLRSVDEQVMRSGSVVDWTVDLGAAPLPVGPATVVVRATDPQTQVEAAPLMLPLTIRDSLTAQHEDLEIPASRFINETPSTVTFNSQTQRHQLASNELEARVLSRGIPPADFNEPTLQMGLGSVMYVDNPFNRGINVVVFNAFDTIPRAIRRYDTWRDPLPAELGHDGYSNECIAFLRDSLLPGDRVLLASCNESFTGFEQDSNLNAFRDVIKGLGSRFADSLAPQSSWAMIGAPGMEPGEASEAWKGAPDTLATTSATLTFSATSGSISTPWIGPARSVDSIVVDVEGPGVTSTVWGRRPDGLVIELGTLTETGSWKPADDEDRGTVVYRVTHALTFSEEGIASIGGAVGSYVEADEWLIEPGDISIDTNEVVRADTATVKVRVRHARSDRTAQPVDIRLTIPDASGTPVEVVERNLGIFSPDERREVFLPAPTRRAPEAATVMVDLNPDQRTNEVYAFNNRASTALSVREDDTPPIVQVLADGADVTNGGYVAPDAFIEVLLIDASNLPINDPSRLTVFINGDRIRDGVAEEVVFLPSDSCRVRYPQRPDVRAGLVFRYPLEDGQNNVLVRGSDATGNEVEHECALFVTNGLNVAAVTVSPNPSSGPVTFRIDLQASVRDLSGTVHIYDAEGRRIASLEAPLQLGAAELQWDGRGSAGEVLPSGLYVYRLEVSEPSIQGASGLNGTLMLLR